MVGDEEDAESSASEFAHGVTQFDLAGNVEGVARLVKEQGVWLVNQGAGDESTLGFPGRHLENGTAREIGNSHAGESGVRAVAMVGERLMIGENPRTAEKAGEDDVEAAGIRCAGSEEVGRDDSQSGAKFEDIPQGAAKNGDGRSFALKGITLASDGLNESGFARTVGAKNADVLADGDAQGEAVKGHVVSAKDSDVAEIEESRSDRGHPVKNTLSGGVGRR